MASQRCLSIIMALMLVVDAGGHCPDDKIEIIKACAEKLPALSASSAALDVCNYLNTFGKCYPTDHCCFTEETMLKFFNDTLNRFSAEQKAGCVVLCSPTGNVQKYPTQKVGVNGPTGDDSFQSTSSGLHHSPPFYALMLSASVLPTMLSMNLLI
jgi:hypothetical protein